MGIAKESIARLFDDKIASKLDNVASKSDIEKIACLIENIRSDFDKELSLRDEEICAMKSCNVELGVRLSDCETQNENLSNSIDKLERTPLPAS